ncbi:MAG TPA: hypothetical protein VKB80_27915 [Kofleriaceae bacterium]|nr:hypothetical protein [Kofleriaceae bacterium]
MARRYVAATVIDRRAIAAAAGWAALGAVLVGAAAHVVARFLFPVELILPAAIGVAVGGAVARSVRRVRLSRPRPAVGIAAAAVVLALLAQLGLDYWVARVEHVRELERGQAIRVGAGLVAREDLEGERAAWLAGWTPWRYARARVGLDDSSMFTGSPPVLGRGGTVVLSLFELALALAIASLWAARAAGEPACPVCGAWRAEHALGSAAHGVSRALVARLLDGDAFGAAELLRPPDTREEVRLSLFRCPAGHDDGAVLRVAEVIWTRHRRLALRRVADLEVTGGEAVVVAAGVGAEVEAR